jgi:23S rRNA (adenine2503-C2)-methyltransferase
MIGKSMINQINQELFYNLSYQDLEKIMATWNQPAYRVQQIWQGVYQKLWNTADQFSSIPKLLREKLFTFYKFSSLNPVKTISSQDKETIKTLFTLDDNYAIEAVLMKYDQRRTLCISTQAGCAMGCVFCATGQMGFKRHLNSGEIIEQVLYYARELAKNDEKVTNIVLMGMGEPFHNYDSTLKAIDLLNDQRGFGLGARRFTISTVGLVPMIRKFADEDRQINLAISLHATTNEERTSLLPINKRYPIEQVLEACRYYVEKTKRRVTFEWALIAGKNDSESTAKQLAHLLRGLLCHVNVIPLNPTSQSVYQPSSKEQTKLFQQTLEQNGIPCTIRLRRGIDIQAGCGQLAVKISENRI